MNSQMHRTFAIGLRRWYRKQPRVCLPAMIGRLLHMKKGKRGRRKGGGKEEDRRAKGSRWNVVLTMRLCDSAEAWRFHLAELLTLRHGKRTQTMPTKPEYILHFRETKILFYPRKTFTCSCPTLLQAWLAIKVRCDFRLLALAEDCAHRISQALASCSSHPYHLNRTKTIHLEPWEFDL